MQTHIQQSAQLGDLVVAAFDEAALYSTDPREVSRLATRVVEHILSRQASRQARELEESTPLLPPRLFALRSAVR